MSAVRIAIVGDGLLPALAAVTLAHRLERGDELTVIATGRGLDGLGPVGHAVAALPDWQRSPAIAALPDAVLLHDRAASFSLGLAFAGWAQAPWFLPFGDSGAPIGAVAFHHLLARQRAAGNSPRLADFSLAAMAAQAERFAFPGDDPRSPLSSLAFGWHFDAGALAAALARFAGEQGVRATAAPLARVETNGPQIEALHLADGSRIEADLYLDCTGTEALLIGETLGVPYASWRHWLPAHRALVTVTSEASPPPPYALRLATPDGWISETPLAGARATATYFAQEAPADALPCESGIRSAAWSGNCVAIGASAAFVEPLLGTPLLLAQNALDRLARLLPAPGSTGVEAREFNRLHLSETECARDMAMTLYATAPATRITDLPDTLARKLDLFASRGVVPMYDDELFEASDWIAMFDGQGLRPRRIDPLAAALPDDRIASHLARLRDRLIATLRAMPSHARALTQLRRPH